MGLSPARPAATALSDADLVDAIRAGDQTAFTELYERYFDRVYNFAYARLRHRADAEEVAQETFLAVFRSIDGFVGRSALLSWIYGIAKNTINNHLRRLRAQELRIERAEEELVRNAHSFESCSPEEHVNYRRCADAALKSLESVSKWRNAKTSACHCDTDSGDCGSDVAFQRRDPLESVPSQATDRRGGGRRVR